MARGNMFLGRAKGKLGSIVYSVRKGVQVSKPWVESVSDAQTRGQVEQRSKMGNVVSTYRAYSRVLQKAFENKIGGQTDYNLLVKYNLTNSDVWLTPAAVDAGACVIAPYIISRGTLPSIQVTEQVNGTFVSDIAVAEDFEITDETTVAELSAAIILANSNWELGDQFTMVQASQYIHPNSGYPMATVRLYDIVLDYYDATVLRTAVPETVLSVINGYLGFTNPAFIGGVAGIQSRTDASGKLRVSSQTVLLTSSDTIYAQYASTAAKEEAIQTRGYNESVYLSPSAVKGGSAIIPPITGGMSIATMTAGSTNLLTENSWRPLATQQVAITGQNLSSAGISFIFFNTSTPVSLSSFATINSESESQIIFTPNSNAANDVRQMIAGTSVIKEWNTDEFIDPSA